MKSKLAMFMAAVFAMSSCSNITYWSDSISDVDYSNYHTYQVDDQCSDYDPGVNPINQQRIKNAIELELMDMGYTRSDDPDLNVKFFVKNETKYFYENCVEDYEGLTGGNQCIDKVYTYEEGTLVIDLIDIRKNMAIWHGGANGESWDSMSDPDAVIKKMVKELMKEYKAEQKATSFAYIEN